MSIEDNERPLETGIHTDLSGRLSYSGYLHLDRLLSAQQRALVCQPANLLNANGTTGGVPAIFAATYAAAGSSEGPLAKLNIMSLGTPRSAVISAIRSMAESVNVSSTPSVPSSAWYCLINEFRGCTSIRFRSSILSASSSTRIGKRPCSSGIRSEGFAT